MSLSGIGIALLALSNCFIKNQSEVILLLFSLKLNSIPFTSVPPVETEIEILAFKLKSEFVKNKVGCCGSGTILFELHTDFSLLSYTNL